MKWFEIRRPRLLAKACALIGVLLASRASAFNAPILQDGSYHFVLGAVPDDDGGAIVVWSRGTPQNDAVYAQRVTHNGTKLWPADGLRIPTPGNYDYYDVAWVFTDQQGGALVVWQTFNADWPRPAISTLRAQRINSGGQALWDTLGVPLCTAPQTRYNVKFVPDGTGGGLFAWMDHRNGQPVEARDFGDYFHQWGSGFDIFAQRIDGSGHTFSGPSGIAIRDTTSFGDIEDLYFPTCAPTMDMVPDGQGGALLAWPDRRFIAVQGQGRGIYAQRVDMSGNALWAKNGVPVDTESRTKAGPRLAADGHGGAVVVWLDERGWAVFHVYAQKLSPNGERLWDLNSVHVSPDSSDNWSPAVVSDDEGGAVIAWAGYTWSAVYVFAQRLDSQGTPQWTIPGVQLADVFHYDSRQRDGGVQLLSDGHGAVRCVVGELESPDVDGYQPLSLRAQRVSESGDLRWGPRGLRLSTWTSARMWSPIVVPSGHGMFVFWSDKGVYGDYVAAGGFPNLTDVGPQQLTDVFSIAPNPLRTSAQLSFSVDRPGRVRATVVDLQGRAVRHLIDRDQIVGRQQIPFDGKDDAGAVLRSSVYFLRVSTPSETSTKAFVIAR